jgi:hypothetical protein
MIAQSLVAQAHFTARREREDNYSAAARNLANQGIGMLHHCLQTRQHYDEKKAFSPASLRLLANPRPARPVKEAGGTR